jgi:hypothetical protein
MRPSAAGFAITLSAIFDDWHWKCVEGIRGNPRQVHWIERDAVSALIRIPVRIAAFIVRERREALEG